MKQKLINKMISYSASNPITLAYDGWTNIRGQKVTNVIPLCAGRAYYWYSIVNASHKNTADWIAPKLKSSLISIISKGIYVVALVADNESVNGACFRLLLPDFPFLIQVPCAAHVIQLIVKKILALDGINDVISTMNRILTIFWRSKDNRLKLHNKQQGAERVYQLIKPNDTRWSSSYYAAERMVKLRDHINIVINEDKNAEPLPDSFWPRLQSLVSCLKPYQQATDILQSDTATLFNVYSEFDKLLRETRKMADSSILYTQKADVENIIMQYWMKHINKSAVISCALLSLDNSAWSQFASSDLTEARKWFLAFGVSYINHYKASDLSGEDEIGNILLDQYSQFVSRSGIFADMNDNYKKLVAKAADQKHATSSGSSFTYFDPKKLWGVYLNEAREICTAAIALLSIVPSEAAVERSFSMQDMIHSKRRNRLLDDSVGSEMFIKFNLQAFDDKSTSQGNYIEINDENVQVEPNAIANLFVVQSRDVDVKSAEEDVKEEEDDYVSDEETETDPVLLFIKKYRVENGVGKNYRWNPDRENHLQQAAIAAQITHTVSDLKVAIMKIVKDSSTI